jgi:hypothetical protein
MADQPQLPDQAIIHSSTTPEAGKQAHYDDIDNFLVPPLAGLFFAFPLRRKGARSRGALANFSNSYNTHTYPSRLQREKQYIPFFATYPSTRWVDMSGLYLQLLLGLST